MTATNQDKIFQLADVAGQAQADFQRDFGHIDPVIGIMRSLRDSGFAADAMTIDSLSSGKRILFILHDNAPETLEYLFGFRDQDPDMKFEKVPLVDATSQQFYQWMKSYFIESCH